MGIDGFGLQFFSLEGRNAIVTGGNSGLGQAFSVALAKAGADVLVVGLSDDDGATRSLIEGAGRRLEFVRADLTEAGVAQHVVQECVERLGSVDILVNCAGICLIADVGEFDRQHWDPMIAVNLTAAFDLSREAGAVMRAQGHGKIVNIASLFSFLGGQGSPAYAASKAGIAGLTKAYCDELAQYNVQVNAIAPGYFATAVSAVASADRYDTITDHIPAGRWGDPADLMGAMVFLASRASDYVNGHVLAVDGGYLVR